MENATLSTLVLIAVIAVLAPILADLAKAVRLPVVVIELACGIAIGPEVLGIAHITPPVTTLSEMGLAMLIFLAGYEIDLAKVKGRPLGLATAGWSLSLGLGLLIAVVLVVTGFAHSTLLIGLTLTTTALGIVLPVLSDEHLLDSRFGVLTLAAGTAGEFLPILAITLFLSGHDPRVTVLLLVVFVAAALASASVALRPRPPTVVASLERGLRSSAQLPVRIAVMLVIAMVWIAAHLGLDILLGAFTAGLVVKLANTGDDAVIVREKLEAIGFGFLVPIFFVVSGMNFDVDAFRRNPAALLRIPVFLVLFLVVRGLPALLYRKDLARVELWSLALFSATTLPLVVVITRIGTATGQMLPANASALVGAAMASVLIYPSAAIAARARRSGGGPGVDAPAATGSS